jgi:hypothetical protein
MKRTLFLACPTLIVAVAITALFGAANTKEVPPPKESTSEVQTSGMIPWELTEDKNPNRIATNQEGTFLIVNCGPENIDWMDSPKGSSTEIPKCQSKIARIRNGADLIIKFAAGPVEGRVACKDRRTCKTTGFFALQSATRPPRYINPCTNECADPKPSP